MSTAKARTSFHFPEDSAVHVRDIQARSRFKDTPSIVRAAVRAYDDLLFVVEAGHRVIVRDLDGRDWPFSPHEPFKGPLMETGQAGVNNAKLPKNFFFGDEIACEIEGIRSRSHLRKGAEVLRACVAAFYELTRMTSLGYDIFVRTDAGAERRYNPFAPLVRDGL